LKIINAESNDQNVRPSKKYPSRDTVPLTTGTALPTDMGHAWLYTVDPLSTVLDRRVHRVNFRAPLSHM
jgi:hypothetical protein